jgi:hypothetical protein
MQLQLQLNDVCFYKLQIFYLNWEWKHMASGPDTATLHVAPLTNQ